MKVKKWYVVMERSDGITEELNVADLPNFIATDIQQYINEVETYRNEVELQKQMEAV
jgi:uncharacterized protein (DUF433 family)